MSTPVLRLKRSSAEHKRPNGSDVVEGEVTLNYHPSTCGFFIKNNNGDIVKIGPVEISTSAPNSSPAGSSGNCEGELWYNPVAEELKIYYNGSWTVIAEPPPTGFTGSVTVDGSTFTISNGIITNVA
jgi:hypothetical protein